MKSSTSELGVIDLALVATVVTQRILRLVYNAAI